nr:MULTISPECIES: GNAT family N-acetyltransferase [unclassified Ochrobactrum]
MMQTRRETITIRRIGLNEVDIFRRIRLEALSCEPEAFASTFEEWALMSDEEWRSRLKEPIFVAFEGHIPLGLIGLLRERPGRMAHRASVVMVYVHATLRGCGLAKSLLDTVKKFGRNAGLRQLELSVKAENSPAIRFYQREGFVEVGRIPAGYLDHGREIDDVLMVCRLVSDQEAAGAT